MPKRQGFHQNSHVRTGFEHELEEALNGFYRSQSYIGVKQVHYRPEHTSQKCDDSTEWYEIMTQPPQDKR